MVDYDDQIRLFKQIGDSIKKNIECFAFGGTAMTFYGYKEETKDVDLLFEKEEDRDEFLRVIKLLRFKEKSIMGIYVSKKVKNKFAPLMFESMEPGTDVSRIDIFLKKIFKARLSPKMRDDLFAIHEFRGKKFTFKVNVLRKEHIVMLKAVTERTNDFDDILNILEKEINFDWQYFFDEVWWQYNHGNDWIVLDVERTLLELKKYIFIPQKFIDQIYNPPGGK